VPKLSEHAESLIHSLLTVDPRKRLSAVEVLSHPWLKDAKVELDVFTQKEKDVIHKEYLSKNIDRGHQAKAREAEKGLLMGSSAGQLNL
jgi:serine/threonine protein kinase